ncbi:MAG: cell division protein ZapA [Muribaculaceae bacterium]|nr:cell division protein ZapA [Muribaculaceae bacterium]
MKDKLNITIRIAELPPFAMQIDRNDEEAIRNAEYQVNKLWNIWRQRYTNNTSTEVLGMVAFQFAKLFTILNMQSEETMDMLDKFEHQLDDLLIGIDSNNANGEVGITDNKSSQ